MARFLGAHADEIIFTSGGTEANNLALMGVLEAAPPHLGSSSNTGRGGRTSDLHIIVSTIEHSSIMETAKVLERRGVEVTYIGVDSTGVVLLDELKKAIKPNTVLISIMTVNNETGVVQPIREIAKIIRHARKNFSTNITNMGTNNHKECITNNSQTIARDLNVLLTDTPYPLFHTDACQAVQLEDLNVARLGVDILTLDASKAYGPRGVGCLYIKRAVIGKQTKDTPSLINPIVFGGGQEKGLRSATENVPAIAGFAEALRLIYDGTDKSAKDREKEGKRIASLKKQFIKGLKEIRKEIVVNGEGGVAPPHLGSSSNTGRVDRTSSHILSITIPKIDNEFLLFQLDAKGIACSTKSACLRDEDESYVLKAMGVNSRESIRFSFGRWTRGGDIKRILHILRSSGIISSTC